ncbi:MAG: AI-2E family transporter [Pseudomonadota bacterium]|nr:AI-2E family transporter [Pseudomonadota bacterium]
MNTPALHRAVFFILLAGSTLGFLWVLMPFFSAVFWAVALALLFNPLFRRLRVRLGGRANLAALLTLFIALVIVILPMIMVVGSLVDDITQLVQRLRSGDINLRSYFNQIVAALPAWATEWLERLGFINLESIVDRISSGLLQGTQMVATRALEIGQNTFQFLVQFVVMLYLLFFLLRDGAWLSRLVRESVPLARSHTHYLLNKFTTVIRATVKGNVVVAIVQGALGGVALWALGIKGAVFWGVVMAFLSLLPAVGAALVWAPVAIYLLATGAIWKGAALIVWGVVVIGLSDNVLRPILVGKDTKMPDYLVLVSTIGGMSLFGINGFVIGPTIAAMFMACWALFNQSGNVLTADEAAPAAPNASAETAPPVELAPPAEAAPPTGGDDPATPGG